MGSISVETRFWENVWNRRSGWNEVQGGMTVQTDDVTAVEGSGGLNARAVPREVHGLVPSINSCFSQKH